MIGYRFLIWKNGSMVDCCMRLSTLLNNVRRLAEHSKRTDVIYVRDQFTNELLTLNDIIPNH